LKDNRHIQIEAGIWMQEIFNFYEHKEWKDYNINETYYLTEIYKEIGKLAVKKKINLELF